MMQCPTFFNPSDRVNVTPISPPDPFRTPTITPTTRGDDGHPGEGRSIFSLHQMLDFLLSENAEQSQAMKKLQEDNEALSKEMQRLKENIEHFQSDSRPQHFREVGRVPPAISVSIYVYAKL